MKKRIAVLLAAFVVVGAACWLLFMREERLGSSRAAEEERLVPVLAAVAGTVREIYVAEGEAVAEGQPLFALDKSVYEVRLAEERERLAEMAAALPADLVVPSPSAAPPQADKPLAVLRAEENEARAAVEIAAETLASANIVLARMKGGAANYAPADPKRQAALIVRDEAATSLQRARESFEKTSYARALAEAREKNAPAEGSVSAALAARVAEYQARISRVRLAEQDLAATVVVAPASGGVVLQTLALGVAVEAGDAPMSILPDKNR